MATSSRCRPGPAALAGATTRVRVQTEVLLAPLRDPVLLAKQVATLDRISGGRFTLGLSIGGRDDDHLAAGIDRRGRGRRLDEQLATMRRIWSGEPYATGVGPIGPAPVTATGPELLFGAFASAALERVARWGDGFLCAAIVGGRRRTTGRQRLLPLHRRTRRRRDRAHAGQVDRLAELV